MRELARFGERKQWFGSGCECEREDASGRGCGDLADESIGCTVRGGNERCLVWEWWGGAGGEERRSRACGGGWAASMYNTILVLVVSKVFGIIKDQAPARILPGPSSSSSVII